MKTLHPHQAAAVDRLRDALRAGYRRPMLQAPTGYGKTVLASAIVQSALEKQKRVLFTVPAVELVDQTVAAFSAEGILDIGVMQAQHCMTNPDCRVQIASVQTLARRKIPPADLVLVDEAHRDFKLFHDWMGDEAWAGVPFIGLSATPWTRGLGRLYDTLIVSATTKDLIEKGFLSGFRVFAPSHPDLSGVRTIAGDYHEGDLSKAMDKRELVADVVTTWLAKAEGRPTLVFAVDRAHAKSLQESFLAAGVNAGYVDANTESADRKVVAKAFRDGSMPVVCNVGVLTTGVDWDVRCIVLARPTKSEILYCQILGRGLRTAKGKSDLLILDHSDSTLRLGFVTDVHHERLSTGNLGDAYEAKPKESLPHECKKCAFVIPLRSKACPNCGAEQAMRQTDVIHHAGELVELNEHREFKTAEKRNRSDDWITKVSFMSQLRAYAGDRNKSDGWVAWKYRDRYGVWPNDPQVRYAPAAPECGIEVMSWITAMNLRWSRAQAKIRSRAS